MACQSRSKAATNLYYVSWAVYPYSFYALRLVPQYTGIKTDREKYK